MLLELREIIQSNYPGLVLDHDYFVHVGVCHRVDQGRQFLGIIITAQANIENFRTGFEVDVEIFLEPHDRVWLLAEHPESLPRQGGGPDWPALDIGHLSLLITGVFLTAVHILGRNVLEEDIGRLGRDTQDSLGLVPWVPQAPGGISGLGQDERKNENEGDEVESLADHHGPAPGLVPVTRRAARQSELRPSHTTAFIIPARRRCR
jgi:hypothetical protein